MSERFFSEIFSQGTSIFSEQERKPHYFYVIIYNENKKNLDFVEEMLAKIFYKDEKETSLIIDEIVSKGSGKIGTYSYDIAMTKKSQAERFIEEAGYFIKITVEEVIE